MKNATIRRPRLIDLADRLLDVRLTLVTAPTGSGKSVLLRQWEEALAGRANVLRLDLRFAHNDAPTLRAAIGEAAAP